MPFSVKEIGALFRRGEFAEADRLCREELALNPGSGEVWHLRGIAAIRAQDFGRAIQYILRAIFHRPGVCEMHLNLGIALRALSRWDEATDALSEAVKIDPSNFQSQLLLASCHFTRKEYPEAERAIGAALALQPQSAEAWEVQAQIAQRLIDHDRAFDSANKAVGINPALPISHRIIADVATRREDYALAEEHYETAIKLDPNNREAQGNFGLLLSRMGHYAKSVDHYRRALIGARSDRQSQYGLSTALLTLANFTEGWPLYALRTPAHGQEPLLGLAQLDRLPAAGERVAVTTDQGPGEQIMFASLLPDLMRTGADLTVTCDERLVPLFQRSFPEVRVIGRSQQPAAATAQIALPDTARWLRRTFSDFPRQNGYLKPDPYMTALLRAKYRSAGEAMPLVGISWRTIQGAKVSTQKTIPLEQWGPILSMPGVTFVNLQYGDCADELHAAEDLFGIQIIKDTSVNATLDLDALAAQIATMDLVITTSNTTAHVAGALNVPTWTLVPTGYGGFWHWFLERADSPWYPSMRLFRQSTRGDWQAPLDEVSAAFAGFVETHRAGR